MSFRPLKCSLHVALLIVFLILLSDLAVATESKEEELSENTLLAIGWLKVMALSGQINERLDEYYDERFLALCRAQANRDGTYSLRYNSWLSDENLSIEAEETVDKLIVPIFLRNHVPFLLATTSDSFASISRPLASSVNDIVELNGLEDLDELTHDVLCDITALEWQVLDSNARNLDCIVGTHLDIGSNNEPFKMLVVSCGNQRAVFHLSDSTVSPCL